MTSQRTAGFFPSRVFSGGTVGAEATVTFVEV